MTPETTPRFGTGRYQNLWFNIGLGHMGFALAAGAARITADLVCGRNPADRPRRAAHPAALMRLFFAIWPPAAPPARSPNGRRRGAARRPAAAGPPKGTST